ncbi:hypothetical protein ACXPWS_07700 [Mycobacterium sp. BMJ-28]
MGEAADVGQAIRLHAELWDEIEAISRKLEAAEHRAQTASASRARCSRRLAAQLRRDLYAAHHLVDGLHRRFPQTRSARHEG